MMSLMAKRQQIDAAVQQSEHQRGAGLDESLLLLPKIFHVHLFTVLGRFLALCALVGDGSSGRQANLSVCQVC